MDLIRRIMNFVVFFIEHRPLNVLKFKTPILSGHGFQHRFLRRFSSFLNGFESISLIRRAFCDKATAFFNKLYFKIVFLRV